MYGRRLPRSIISKSDQMVPYALLEYHSYFFFASVAGSPRDDEREHAPEGLRAPGGGVWPTGGEDALRELVIRMRGQPGVEGLRHLDCAALTI